MTEKQEKILATALALFAREGYHATSTSRIAKQAGVSEALIFRHFENKEGLLKAILDVTKGKARQLFADIVLTADPKTIIRKALELPFMVQQSEFEAWRLTYALKWQTASYDSDMSEPLKMALANAFKKLEYKNPDAEAEIVMMLIDGAATAILLHEPPNRKEIMKALFKKYDL